MTKSMQHYGSPNEIIKDELGSYGSSKRVGLSRKASHQAMGK
jgi:hypothetical protein